MEYRASQKARNLLHILRYVRGYVFHKKIPGNKLLQPPHLPAENRVTWDQAQFSFCFVNNIPAGKGKLLAVAIREKCMRTAKIGPDLGWKTEHTATAKT